MFYEEYNPHLKGLSGDNPGEGNKKVEVAEDIALRYCRMTDTKAMGNYENFDALTGKGLCAPGYTRSAGVYMLFRSEY